jgi:anti-sigma-K factor RskA
VRSARDQMEAGKIVSGREVADMAGQLAEAREATADTADRLAAFIRSDGRSRLNVVTLTSMPGGPPQSLAVAVWDPRMQQGMLEVAKLPSLPPDKDYQLWVIDPKYPAPVNGGVFRVDPSTCQACVAFRTSEPVERAAKFAVSLEQRGGVPQRTGPIVLFGD